MQAIKKRNFCQSAKRVIATELAAIDRLFSIIDSNFEKACECLLACQGRIIITGMGKSGHIGNKIAATMASTGSPAFFVHSGEASHGDLGMITQQDVVLAISGSGRTEELLLIVPLIKNLQVPLIAITGNPQSILAQAADIHLDAGVKKEACPLNLAPTASTTATLVIGDALAIALLEARGFTQEDFALTHPAGYLGKRLLLRINAVMHQGQAIPWVSDQASLQEAIVEMTKKTLGMTAVVDKNRKLLGIFTDGDLRRTLEAGFDIKNTIVSAVMTRNCKTAKPDMLAVEAFELMEKHKIFPLLVVDDDNNVVGAFNMHDLFRAGVAR